VVPEVKAGIDSRVTSRFAAFCRKYSIDELPQLWHVVHGEMSLVGPRPMTVPEWDKHYGTTFSEVLNLKPGLSGLWQIRGRNRLTYRQRRRLDIFLARHYCLLLYVRILGQTVPRVIAGRDAW
jgi:exopolysaccharide production protein ExoY